MNRDEDLGLLRDRGAVREDDGGALVLIGEEGQDDQRNCAEDKDLDDDENSQTLVHRCKF